MEEFTSLRLPLQVLGLGLASGKVLLRLGRTSLQRLYPPTLRLGGTPPTHENSPRRLRARLT